MFFIILGSSSYMNLLYEFSSHNVPFLSTILWIELCKDNKQTFPSHLQVFVCLFVCFCLIFAQEVHCLDTNEMQNVPHSTLKITLCQYQMWRINFRKKIMVPMQI